MKKALAIALMLCSLCACTQAQPPTPVAEAPTPSPEVPTPEVSTVEPEAPTPEANVEVELSPEVEVDESFTYLKFTATNNGESPIYIISDFTAINDYMWMPSIHMELEPGETKTAEPMVLNSEVGGGVEYIDLVVNVCDSATYAELEKIKLPRVTVTPTGTVNRFTGETVYSGECVDVVKVSDTMYLFINKMDEMISVETDDGIQMFEYITAGHTRVMNFEGKELVPSNMKVRNWDVEVLEMFELFK